MKQFDEALRLFEELDGLNDGFIEEGMLSDEAVAPPRRGRRRNPFARLAGSGWGVAALCAAVSLAVVAALIRFAPVLNKGMGAEDAAPGSPNFGANRYDEDKAEEETVDPEEEVTLPDESNRVPAGNVTTDGAGLCYRSYGNGTCILAMYRGDPPLTRLHIPTYSPAGDVVVAIDGHAFRNAVFLEEVTLPAGLRELDHNTFPVDAPIYTLYGNILYLGSARNPHMAAVATADNRPGATALHPNTRIVACHALTYDAGSAFAEVWGETVPAYGDSPVFTIPSGVIHIGSYGILDVGRDITYRGYLVGWDSLTAEGRSGLGRTADGMPLTVHCMDGDTETLPKDISRVQMDGTANIKGNVLFGGYFMSGGWIHEAYYDWRLNPEAFEEEPAQFVTGCPYGEISRVLTEEELARVTFTRSGAPGDEALDAFVEAYNRDPAAHFKGQSVVMLYVREHSLYDHVVTDVSIRQGRIHVILSRVEGVVATAEGSRFILIPLDDPNHVLVDAAVTYEIAEGYVPPPHS